jgi:hypothetical protein
MAANAFWAGLAQRKLALLLIFTAFSAAIALAQKPPMVDVGVVLPQDVITGETVSGSIVVNPNDYSSVPGLHVVKGQIPGVAGSTSTNLLSFYSLRIGVSASTIPADHPFSFIVTNELLITIFRTGGNANEGWSTTIPLQSGGGLPRPRNFSLPPLNLAGAIQRIHGPFSGDGNRTAIRVNNLPARLLVESPRGAYCFIPSNVPPGPADWTINDEKRSVRLRSWVLALQMSADKLKLMKGESTAFHVVIKGVETIPQEAWFGSGDVPDFIDPAIIRKFLPDFKPPSSTQPGVLVLTLENISVGTVVMSGGNKVALTFGYGQGRYEYHGTITATRAGSFNIDGTLIPFLHDQPELVDNTISGGNNNDNVGNPPVHTPSATPTPVATTTENKKKEEDCPQRGKGCVALIIDFSHNVSWEFDMDSLSKKLTAAGCETDYVAPDLMEIPLPETYGYEGVASYTTKPDPKDQDAARDHNTPEWKKVRDAITKHREKVAKGVELAIEIVNGHGDGKTGEGLMRCGDWVWKEYSGDFLLRADFHEGNYHAANKNVCGWFTSDFSCYGGLTPKVVDELENLTTSTCSQASAVACPNHAGWEADSSTSTATNTKTCSNGSIGWQKSYIGDPLDAETDRRKGLPAGSASSYSGLIGALRSKAGESSTSRYADKGYAKDKPPAHVHGGYDQP